MSRDGSKPEDINTSALDHSATVAAAVSRIEATVRSQLTCEAAGHDWSHVARVARLGAILAAEEHCDELLVHLACLLHDIADWKLHNGDEEVGPRRASEILAAEPTLIRYADQVYDIIRGISFRGALVADVDGSIELCVVRDADRLDALGAIGIARAFSFGGARGEILYNPNIAATPHDSASDYVKGSTTTINHFYEKLLLLADRMATQKAKALARERTDFMRQYLERFFGEWEGRV